MLNTENLHIEKTHKLSDKDKGRIKELDTLVKEITKDMDSLRFYLAAEKIYHYFWHILADVIIEESKDVFINGSDEDKKSTVWMLIHILETCLKLLHPFMPFITEEIWSHLGNKKNMLIVEPWPDTK